MAEKFLIVVVPNSTLGKPSMAVDGIDPKEASQFSRMAVVQGKFSGATIQWRIQTFLKKSGTDEVVADEEHRARDATLGVVLATEMVDSIVFIEQALLDSFQRTCTTAGIETTLRQL